MSKLKNGMRPVHPGEVLREDYLKPMGLSANAVAVKLGVPASAINDISHERRGVSAVMALRLARFFGGDAESWCSLQAQFELRTAEIASAKTIEKEITPFLRAANMLEL